MTQSHFLIWSFALTCMSVCWNKKNQYNKSKLNFNSRVSSPQHQSLLKNHHLQPLFFKITPKAKMSLNLETYLMKRQTILKFFWLVIILYLKSQNQETLNWVENQAKQNFSIDQFYVRAMID